MATDAEYKLKIEKEDWEFATEKSSIFLSSFAVALAALVYKTGSFETKLVWLMVISTIGFLCIIVSSFLPKKGFFQTIFFLIGLLAEIGVISVGFGHSLWYEHQITYSWIAPAVYFCIFVWRSWESIENWNGWNTISNGVTFAWNGLGEFATYVWTGLGEFATYVWTGLGDFATYVWALFVTLWTEVRGIGVLVWGWVVICFEFVWDDGCAHVIIGRRERANRAGTAEAVVNLDHAGNVVDSAVASNEPP